MQWRPQRPHREVKALCEPELCEVDPAIRFGEHPGRDSSQLAPHHHSQPVGNCRGRRQRPAATTAEAAWCEQLSVGAEISRPYFVIASPECVYAVGCRAKRPATFARKARVQNQTAILVIQIFVPVDIVDGYAACEQRLNQTDSESRLDSELAKST